MGLSITIVFPNHIIIKLDRQKDLFYKLSNPIPSFYSRGYSVSSYRVPSGKSNQFIPSLSIYWAPVMFNAPCGRLQRLQ